MREHNTERTTYIGLDAHKRRHRVAVLLPGEKTFEEWEIPNEARSIKRMVKKVIKMGPRGVCFCYEAGPCGYALQRQIEGLGAKCVVVAPSLVPVKPGERIKTDRRDARKLAKMLASGLLTEVRAPTREEESVRDLCRCREDVREDLTRNRHRMSKFLLRRGMIYPKGKNWTKRHRAWLRSLSFEDRSSQVTFEQYLIGIEQLEERLRGVEAEIETLAQSERYQEAVGWLCCFRGIKTITAMTLLSELHDFRRFHSARELMAYLGLVPSEDSSGDRRRRGSITKTGNRHVRRVLVETGWHYRHLPTVGIDLRRRREGQPGSVISLAEKAQNRLHRRFWYLCNKGKSPNKAVVAVARELVGFIWSVLAVQGQDKEATGS